MKDKSSSTNTGIDEGIFRYLIDSSNNWVYVTNEYDEFVYVSPAVTTITGYSPSDFYADPQLLKKIIHPEDQQSFYAFQKDLKDYVPENYLEFRIITNQGEIEWISHDSKTFKNKFGVKAGTRSSNRLITDKKNLENDLIQSKNLISKLIDSNEESIFLVDADCNFLTSNETGAKRLGKSKEELVGKTIFDLLPIKTAEQRLTKVQEVIRSKKPTTFFDERAGMTFENRIYPILGDNESINQVTIYAKDISEKIRIENELKETKDRFEQIITHIPSVVWEYMLYPDSTNSWTYITKNCVDLFEYSSDEIIENPDLIWNGIHPQDLPTVIKEQQRAQSKKDLFFIDFRYQTKSGNWKWVQVRSKLSTETEDGVQTWTGNVLDVTKETDKSIRLKESEQKLAHFLRANPAGIIFMNVLPPMPLHISKEKRFTWLIKNLYINDANDSVARDYGFLKSADIIGKRFFDIIGGNVDVFKGIFNLIDPHKYQVKDIVTKEITINGEEVFFINNTVATIKENHLYSIDAATFNITEKVQLEKRLEKTLVAKDKFLSIISHDLRSPFMSILGLEDMILSKLEQNDFDEIHHFTSLLKDASQKTYNLLENLLMWAQAQRNTISFSPKVTAIIPILEEVISVSKPSASNKNIALISNIDTDFKVLVDRNMLSVAIRNLISNAIKFTPEHGEIRIASSVTHDQVSITITDNGMGMSKEKVKSLFQVEQAKSTHGTGGEKGSGLGLLLCHEFITKNQGSLMVKSKPEKGTSFTIILPNHPP